jgi:hypothetical protein
MSDFSEIREKMVVVAANGRAIGFVSSLGPGGLRITSVRDGRGFDHVIPAAWIAAVDRYVFLNKSSGYVMAHWDAVSTPAGPVRSPRAA